MRRGRGRDGRSSIVAAESLYKGNSGAGSSAATASVLSNHAFNAQIANSHVASPAFVTAPVTLSKKGLGKHNVSGVVNVNASAACTLQLDIMAAPHGGSFVSAFTSTATAQGAGVVPMPFNVDFDGVGPFSLLPAGASSPFATDVKIQITASAGDITTAVNQGGIGMKEIL